MVGALLTFALWVASLFTHGGASIAGPVWLAIGAVSSTCSRAGREGRRCFGRASPRWPTWCPSAEAETRRILVPLKLGEIGEEVLATAIKLAEDSGAEVRVIHVLRVPLSLPLDCAARDGGGRRARVDRRRPRDRR